MTLSSLLLGGGLAAAPPDKPGDLVLPLPGEQSIAFRPVLLEAGDSPLASREFRIGDRAAGGFQEHPTRVTVGGSFRVEHGGTPAWCYYLGKCEVTEAQYYAIMEPARGEGSPLPMRNISPDEIETYLAKLNEWLFAHAREHLPTRGETIGFVRLPTEIEWEFAARGGAAVSENVFDSTHPYGEDLVRHEWFSGPASSHNRVRPVGQLRPNPLGLHDMLGNVAELTSSPYRVEYYLGRQGGLVARGGDVFTPENRIRSSLRNEQPLYDRDLKPARQATLGFRLALGAIIYDGPATTRAIESAWEAHRRTRRAPASPEEAAQPVSVTARQRVDELEDLIKRLSGQLGDPAPAELGLLRASLGDIAAAVARGEAESAGAWVRIASNTALVLSRELAKVRKSELLLELTREAGPRDSAQRAGDEKRHQQLLQNITDGWNQYGDAIRQLQKLDPETVQHEFTEYAAHVAALGIEQHPRLVELARTHAADYRENLRVDLKSWSADLGTVWNGEGPGR